MRGRSRGGTDPHLDLKIGLFFLAAGLGVSGMLLAKPPLIYAAMVVIGVGLLLRFFGPRAEPPTAERGAGEAEESTPEA